MERLTEKDWDSVSGSIFDAVRRLQEIENILGDTYDLDRLRELMEADKMVGKQLWFTKWFSLGIKVERPPISRCVISFSRLRDKSILLHLKDGAIPINLIGDIA